jgi:hypothetical protein
VFEAIGNALGSYYEVDYSFEIQGYYGMERILVGLETNKGLVEEMVIKRKTNHYYSLWTMKAFPLSVDDAIVMGI